MIWRVSVAAVLCLVALPGRHRAAGQSYDLPLSRSSSFQHRKNVETAAAENRSAHNSMDVFRLPADVQPVAYALQVATDFADFAFSGRVEVTVRAVKRTCLIAMNANGLRVTGVEVVDGKSDEPLTVADHYLVDRNEQLIVALNDTAPCLIPSRVYVVRMEFNASLRDDMSGYYKSSYKENGEIKWLAVTQFEPTHARKAFPCFDEPSFKVPFKVSIRRRSDQISLSNMPLWNSTRIGKTNLFWDHFQETPPMSTYLVAFFVGDFYVMKTRNVGVYTHESYINQAQYITSKSLRLIEAMENFTGVEYMLPKLDMLAIPDFSAGAMENWGLNTYRERLLLLPANSRTKTKEFVTTVVQHELSHQWFGDLVTCAWWDYLWLNEGFATFFEYFATKMVEPDWRLEDVFVFEVHQLALEYDQTPKHPISGSVYTPAEISAMFDHISYSKAGAVLRMLQYTITEANFRESLNFYLNNNAYTAVTPEQLWIALENVLYDNEFDLGDNLTITQYMKSWTEQAGYPLVTIVKENNTFIITQERFLVTASNETTESSSWIIGLTYTTESSKNFSEVLPTTWLKTNEIAQVCQICEKKLPNQNDSEWYIFNLQSTGFYRVNYDEQNWNALTNQFFSDYTVIHVRNRVQVIDDLFNLALVEKVEYPLVLRLLLYLKKEDDVFPWYTAKYELGRLLNRMRRCSKGYKNLKLYVRHLADSIYLKIEDLVVNQNKTDHSTMTSWNSFSNWACHLDSKPCTKSALSYFQMWREGKTIPADIKDAALCVGVKYGGPEIWNNVLEVYVNSESAADRQAAQFALACSTDSIQLAKYLDFMFDGYNGPIRPQDFRVIYQTLASTPEGITALIEFLTNKLDRIVNQIIDGNKVAVSIYSILASRVAHNDEISKMDQLRSDQSVPEYLRKSFNSSFGAVDENLAWFKTHHPKIEKWSKTYVTDNGLDKEPIIPNNASEVSPDNTEMTTAHTHRSSGVSLNSQAIVFTTYIILLTLFLNVLRNF